MQAPDTQRGAKPRNQTVEIAARLRERNGVFRQAYAGIDSEQREIRLTRGDPLRQRLDISFNGVGRRHENGGRLQLLDRA